MWWSGRGLKPFWIISLNNCFILVISLAVASFAYGFFITPTKNAEAASITEDYLVTSGLDLTSEVATSFTFAEIGKLRAVDGNRIQSNGLTWPQGNDYDESKYLEFFFSPDIPEGATIESVVIKNNFRRSGALSGAKLEIWDGQSFIGRDISVGPNSTSDTEETIDVSSIIISADQINNLKIRFLAYRGLGGNTKTSHDYLGLEITYSESIPDMGTNIDSNILVDTTWTKASSPYIINNRVTIEKGVTLTIEPGVVIKFSGLTNASIMVLGKIMANGTHSEPIYFTSSFDDTLGGSTDNDYEGCYYESYDAEGNPIGQEICETFDIDEVAAGDWQGIYFIESQDSILKNVFFLYGDDVLSFESSKVDFENINISDSIYGMIGDEDSNIQISGGVIKNIEEDAITFFDNSSLLLDGVKIENVKSGLIGYISNSYKENYPDKPIYENAKITITNSDLGCLRAGITIFNNYALKVSNSTVSCLIDGVTLFNEVTAEIDQVKISGASGSGITSFNITKPDMIKVINSEIFENKNGFLIFNSTFSANQNYIHDNLIKGVDTFDGGDLDFTSNYWGDPSGPTHLSNPNGKGDAVSDNVIYNPFLTTNPLVPKTGLSNVMFIPGFEGSRMYQMVEAPPAGSLVESRLWEPRIIGSVSEMKMDKYGDSLKEIYTRDILERATIGGVGVKSFYKSFSAEMDDLVVQDKIAAWKAIPYDWRLSPLDIVERGIEESDGNISYDDLLSKNQIPYIIDQLQKLVDSSKSGKVTIVTHSNGGLVAKALIAKLENMKSVGQSNLIDKIDNLIMVAAPQLGTPKAIPALLHGYDQGIAAELLVSRNRARDFGLNTPGAYGLLPSQRYTDEIENDLILFGESLDKVNNWRKTYGDSINSYTELQHFLLDNHGLRSQADYSDLKNPVELNENVFNIAKNLHNRIDDSVIPDNIKVYHLAGWGMPTPYDLRYQSKNICSGLVKILCLKKEAALSSDIGITYKGDKTVVGESALFGQGENYYLNLNDYNFDSKEGKLFYSEKNHANIFEVSYVFDFVNNIINGKENDYPQYITKTEPGSYDFTIFKLHSPVGIDVYDEDGMHTGIIEGDDGQEIIEENIPNSVYMGIGDDKYIVVPKDGNYRLELTGLDAGIFTLEQVQLVDDVEVESVMFVDIPTTQSLRGKVEITNNQLAANILIDQDNDAIYETKILPTSKNQLDPEDDIIKNKVNKSRKSGSYLSQNILPISETEKIMDKSPIVEIGKITYARDEKQNSQAVVATTMTPVTLEENISIDQEITPSSQSTPEEIENKFNWPAIIIAIIILLLLSIKFIIK